MLGTMAWTISTYVRREFCLKEWIYLFLYNIFSESSDSDGKTLIGWQFAFSSGLFFLQRDVTSPNISSSEKTWFKIDDFMQSAK